MFSDFKCNPICMRQSNVTECWKTNSTVYHSNLCQTFFFLLLPRKMNKQWFHFFCTHLLYAYMPFYFNHNDDRLALKISTIFVVWHINDKNEIISTDYIWNFEHLIWKKNTHLSDMLRCKSYLALKKKTIQIELTGIICLQFFSFFCSNIDRRIKRRHNSKKKRNPFFFKE